MDDETETELRERVVALTLGDRRRKRFAGESVEEFEEMIAAANVVQDESRLALARWVQAGRRAGLSWADIGRLLDISRQAAQQRFGGEADDVEGGGRENLVARTGVNAFNEMKVLAEEGRAGRELIRAGLLALLFKETNAKWEYKRITSISVSPTIAKLSADGWVYVSTWFPFHYFKRRLPR